MSNGRSAIHVRRLRTGSPELSLLENDPDDDLAPTTTSSSSSSSPQSNFKVVVVRDSGHYISTLAAGVGSGALASVVCAPLDLVRTRMQVWGDIGVGGASTPMDAIQQILVKEGWRGMFRGLGATLVTVPLFWGVYFPLYDETKHKMRINYPDVNVSIVHMGSAVFTGAVADVICNPLFRLFINCWIINNCVKVPWLRRHEVCWQIMESKSFGGA